jgi:hypothetical protein
MLSSARSQVTGGFTQTHALLPGSPAINAANVALAPSRDQRGHLRVGAPDIGAFEFDGFATPRPDFDRDEFTDFLLFNSSTLRTAIWYFRGSAFVSGAFGPSLPAGWAIVGVADFDQNGAPDYLLFRPSTRQTAIWYLNDARFIGGSLGPTLPAGWKLVTAVDINLDGKPDYLLFNPATRQTAIWFLNWTTFSSGALGPTLPPGWTVVDAVDFDSSSKPD